MFYSIITLGSYLLDKLEFDGGRQMKNKIKTFLRWLAMFLLCFIVIYLFVFLGGWKLFESGDPILIEVGIAFILSFFVFIISEVVTGLGKRVKSLEERIKKLENKE